MAEKTKIMTRNVFHCSLSCCVHSVNVVRFLLLYTHCCSLSCDRWWHHYPEDYPEKHVALIITAANRQCVCVQKVYEWRQCPSWTRCLSTPGVSRVWHHGCTDPNGCTVPQLLNTSLVIVELQALLSHYDYYSYSFPFFFLFLLRVTNTFGEAEQLHNNDLMILKMMWLIRLGLLAPLIAPFSNHRC